MRNSRINAAALTIVLAAFLAGRLEAQSGSERPMWETLIRASIPQETLPKLNVLSLPPVPPAPPVPREPGAGHTHAGPVFGYILHGEIENLVEPDPPAIYKTAEVFYETPFHLHRYLRNVSTTEPANVLIFQAGDTGQRNPAIKLLMEEPFEKTAHQVVSLRRLTLPAGALSGSGRRPGPGIVYVLEGTIEASGPADQPRPYGAGELFVQRAYGAGLTFKNTSNGKPAKLLLYSVSEGGEEQ